MDPWRLRLADMLIDKRRKRKGKRREGQREGQTETDQAPVVLSRKHDRGGTVSKGGVGDRKL